MNEKIGEVIIYCHAKWAISIVDVVCHKVVFGGLFRHHGALRREVLESNELEGPHHLLHLVEGQVPVEEDDDEVAVKGLCFVHQAGKAVREERTGGWAVATVGIQAWYILQLESVV